MGQRLAIIFYDDSGKRFLTSYYHWSAYEYENSVQIMVRALPMDSIPSVEERH